MKKRTNWDFSEYSHRVEIFKSESGKEIRVDHLQKDSSRIGYVKFVNDSEGLSVFGDFGNWVFCRPFHPSADGFVSEMYWIEKLNMHSCQDPYDYDCDSTREDIEDLVSFELEENGFKGEKLEQAKSYLNDLLDYVDDPIEYKYHAFRYSMPSFFDCEDIPFVQKYKPQLEIVFDAFEHICFIIKNNQK